MTLGKSGVVSIIALIVVVLALAACSSGDSTTTATTAQAPAAPQSPAAAAAPSGSTQTASNPQTAAAAAQPTGSSSGPAMAVEAQVNRVVLGMTAPANEGISPRHLDSPHMIQISPMYEYLIGLDPETGKLVPQLATEWSFDASNLAFSFKLRDGVQFQKGWGAFTATDVLHSYNDTVREDSQGFFSTYWRDTVASVEINNANAVTFNLAKPDTSFLSTLSQEQGSMEIQSKAHFDAAGDPDPDDQPIAGTGPNQFMKRSVGSFVRYERVPFSHWRITPDFPEFEYRFQQEPSTRLAALLTGEIHITTLPEDLLVEAVKRGEKAVQGGVPALRAFVRWSCCYADPATGIYPMFPDSPLLDVRVRQALNQAINREELNTAFFGGKGDTMLLNHFHPTRLGWNPDWGNKFADQYGYDPAAARALLAEAGYSSGSPVETNLFVFEVNQFAGAIDVAESIEGYWSDIGVDVNLLTVSSSVARSMQRACEQTNHGQIVGTSSTQMTGVSVFHSQVRFNSCSGIKLPEVNVPMAKIMTELDLTKQAALWRELGDIAFDQYWDVPLFWLPAEAVINPEIVSNYVFPGSISGTWTHPEYIKAAQ